MSDLSNLLGDVYGDSTPDSAPIRREPAASERTPEWASDSRLDRAFSGWEPESHFPFDQDVATPKAPAVDDDLAAALTAALSEAAPPVAAAAWAPPAPPAPEFAPPAFSAPAPAPVVVPVPPVAAPAPPAPAPIPRAGWTASPTPAPTQVVSAPMSVPQPTMWSPGDDDIYPGSKGSKR
jgi:hypothetical protein